MTKNINWTAKADRIVASFMMAGASYAMQAAASVREHTGLPVTSEAVLARWPKIREDVPKHLPWSQEETEILSTVVATEGKREGMTRAAIGRAVAAEILDVTGLFRTVSACVNKAMREFPQYLPEPMDQKMVKTSVVNLVPKPKPADESKKPFIQTVLRICADNASDPAARTLVEILLERKQVTAVDLLDTLWPTAV